MEWWNGIVEWNSGMEWWNDHAHRARSVTTYTQYISVFSSQGKPVVSGVFKEAGFNLIQQRD